MVSRKYFNGTGSPCPRMHCNTVYSTLPPPSDSASPRLTMSAHPTNLSIVAGATDNPLWTMTLGELIETQAKYYGGRTAVVFPWQNISRTYHSLSLRSKLVAKALLAAGLQHGDCVAITAGNCYQYIEVFFGAARIGCPVVVLNSTYTPTELQRAAAFSGM